MNKLLDAFNGGTVEQQTRRKKGMLLIAATSALLILATLILIIGTVVALITGNTSGGDEWSQDDTRYVKGSFDTEDLYEGNLLLLDASHPYRGGTPNTVLFSDKTYRAYNNEKNPIYFMQDVVNFRATTETVKAFANMMKAFYAATENDCVYIMQANVGPGAQADTLYQAATTIKLGYFIESGNISDSIYGEEDYKWIYDHAHEYGFIQASKAEGDESIFRYVGIPHATYMKANNLTLSRYLEKLQDSSYKKSLKITVGGEEYRVYYVAADDDVYVPDHGDYTLSGDNMGGYIVTVHVEK